MDQDMKEAITSFILECKEPTTNSSYEINEEGTDVLEQEEDDLLTLPPFMPTTNCTLCFGELGEDVPVPAILQGLHQVLAHVNLGDAYHCSNKKR